MKGTLVVRVLGAVGAAALSVAMFGSGVASAKDPLIGKTYDDAAAVISEKMHGEAVVATVSGGRLERSECIVMSWQKSTFLNSSGDNDRSNHYLLSLNCNNDVASPGHPGNSVMTPQGAQGKKDQESAALIKKNPAWCETLERRMQWCEDICNRTGLCEI